MQPPLTPSSPDLDAQGADPLFAPVEVAFATFQEAWGAWMVGHHRGAPVDEEDGDEAALVARLVATRTALGRALAALDDAALPAADAAAVANIRASLPDLDAWPEPLDGLVFDDAPAATMDLETDADVVRLRRATFDAWGAAMADLRVDGEVLDRLTVASRLGREPDAAARRRLFLGMAPGWAVLDGPGGPDDPDGPYRRLVRASAARWQRTGSPIDANATALGMDPDAVEPTLREVIATFRRVAMPAGLVEPWDYRYVVDGLARRLDRAIPRSRLRPINDLHLAEIGAEPAALRIEYDIVPRPGRPVIPTAFTVTLDIARRIGDRWIPARPWVFATYVEGGLGNLEELIHESGHAVHSAALRARPALFAMPPDHSAFIEAIADVVGWTTHEPAFLERHLGAVVTPAESVVARHGAAILDACWTLFEIELHRHPERPPNEVWAEIVEGGLGVAGHPEWSWWAHRGQLIDGPGYMSSYAIGSVAVAAIRARIRELRGDWATGDPGWYAFVSERLLRFAGSRAPRDVLRDFLGGPLTADALLADIDRAG